MICPVCGNNRWSFERRYHKQDKYEKWCGVPEPICRAWYKCERCGLMKVRHSYDISLLQPIYTNGYRAKNFRGGSIEQEFNKIISIPFTESENKQRVQWLQQFVGVTDKLLDVGAGLGVFLHEMLFMIPTLNVAAVEPNKDSVRFINDMGIPCCESFYRPSNDEKFDWITCIHVLEHQKKPEDMLLDFRHDLKHGGRVYIEVPDACEFDYLEDDNDEFNSTHLYFFSHKSLAMLLESCGYNVTDIRRVRTNVRNLSRIMMVAQCN